MPAATDRPPPTGLDRFATPWRQFWIGLGLMLPWPAMAAVVQPLGSPADFDLVIYFMGLFWTLLWDPIAAAQHALPLVWADWFTVAIVVVFALMWLAIAALPLLGRWPGRQMIGLWALQFAYAGAQAISGFFYVKSVM